MSSGMTPAASKQSEPERLAAIAAEAEERLQLAVGAADLGTFFCPMPLGKILWNAKCKEHFWLPPDAEVDIDLFYSCIHSDDRERVRFAIENAIYKHLPYDVEYRTVASDGRHRWIRAKGRAYYNAAGEPTRFDGITIDVTPQKVSDQRLQQERERAEASLAQWTAVVENMTEGVVISDMNGVLLDWNRAAVEMHGYSDVDSLRRNLSEFVDNFNFRLPDGTLLPLSEWPLSRLLRGEEFTGYEVELTRLDINLHLVVSFSGVLIRDGSGAPKIALLTLHNVTNERRVEKELRDKAQRLDLALAAADLGDWSWEPDTDRVILSHRTAEIFGMQAGPQVRNPSRDVLYEPDRERARLTMEKAIADRGDYNIEYRVKRPDGTLKWVEANGRGQYEPGGKLIRMLGVVQDITERKEAEEALHRSEERFRFLSELSELTSDLTDPEEVMVAVAEKLGTHLRVSRCAYADVESDSNRFTIRHDYMDGCASTVGEYRLEQFGANVAAQIRAGKTLVVHNVDAELQPADGADTFNSIGIKAIICCPLVRAGRLYAMMAVHQTTPRTWLPEEVELVDVVVERSWAYIERARVSRDLVEAHHRLRLAQRAGKVGVFDWIIRESRVVWSPELERLFGLEEGTFGSTFDDWRKRVVPEDAERVEAGLIECMSKRQTDYTYEFRAVLPDGTHRWLIGHAQFLYDSSGTAIRLIGVNVDNTEQRKLLEARESLLESERVARSEAERVSQMKDEFLATLSHELRTPLNAVLGWASILRSGRADPDDFRQGLETIDRNARAQAQIIEDLLDMSRIISGKVRLDVQRVELSAVLRSAIETVRPTAEAKGVKLHMVLDPLTAPVSGDPNRLQQVFWNLLSNSIKFTPKGGRIHILLEQINSQVDISIIDTGEGIDADFLPFVFDRFRQADASTTRVHGGLGLGLAIVKQLVELHGGRVHVKSPGRGHGSTFIVSLPRLAVHPDPDVADRRKRLAQEESAVPAAPAFSIDGVKVLVVDDEPDARLLVQRVLKDGNAIVTVAASAAEAMEKLIQSPPDVLVSDVGIPGEDGYSLIRKVRALGPARGGNVPAIALTAYARSEDRMRAVLAGFQMHVAKPVDPVELVAMIASLAGRAG